MSGGFNCFDEVTEGLTRYEDDRGLAIPMQAWVITARRGNVRSWHLADIGLCTAHICFWPKPDMEGLVVEDQTDSAVASNSFNRTLQVRFWLRVLCT